MFRTLKRTSPFIKGIYLTTLVALYFQSCTEKPGRMPKIKYVQASEMEFAHNGDLLVVGTRNDYPDYPQYKVGFIKNMNSGYTQYLPTGASSFNPQLDKYKDGYLYTAYGSVDPYFENDQCHLFQLDNDLAVKDQTGFGFRVRVQDQLCTNNQCYIYSYDRAKMHSGILKFNDIESIKSQDLKVGKETTIPTAMAYHENHLYLVGNSNSVHAADTRMLKNQKIKGFLAKIDLDSKPIWINKVNSDLNYFYKDVTIHNDTIHTVSHKYIENDSIAMCYARYDLNGEKLFENCKSTNNHYGEAKKVLVDNQHAYILTLETINGSEVAIILKIDKQGSIVKKSILMEANYVNPQYMLINDENLNIITQSRDKRNGDISSHLIIVNKDLTKVDSTLID